MILAPIVRGRKGEFEAAREAAESGLLARGSTASMRRLDEQIDLDKKRNHTIEVVVDRLLIKPGITQRLEASVEHATKLAEGVVVVCRSGRRRAALFRENGLHRLRDQHSSTGTTLIFVQQRLRRLSRMPRVGHEARDRSRQAGHGRDDANRQAELRRRLREVGRRVPARSAPGGRPLLRYQSRDDLCSVASQSARCVLLRSARKSGVPVWRLPLPRGVEGGDTVAARCPQAGRERDRKPRRENPIRSRGAHLADHLPELQRPAAATRITCRANRRPFDCRVFGSPDRSGCRGLRPASTHTTRRADRGTNSERDSRPAWLSSNR